MSGVFAGVFEILKKERNESEKERKIEEIEWFVVSPASKKTPIESKTRRDMSTNDFKSYENYFSMLFKQ